MSFPVTHGEGTHGNSPAKKALTLNFSRKSFDLSMRSLFRIRFAWAPSPPRVYEVALYKPNSEQGIAADARRLSALGNGPLRPDLNLQFVLPGAPPIL